MIASVSRLTSRQRGVPSWMFALLLSLIVVNGCGDKSKGAEPARGGSAAGGGGGKGGGRGGRDMKFPVEVQPVKSEAVEYGVSGVGSVEAFETVAVTARVAGAVERVRFIEGQLVREGELLVEIEPERYRLGVEAARANFEKAKAGLSEAEAGLARREAANAKSPGLIPREQVDTFRTRVETERSEVSQARAALNQAELNLRDALVRSPVGGTIQTRTVQTGEYKPVGSVLATLVRRDPLLLRFMLAEGESNRLRPGMPVTFSVSGAPDGMGAKISHVAGSADPSSRMVQITARIGDPRRGVLKPGSFARVYVPIGDPRKSAVVPQTAIRPSERGFLAFVVENGKAEERVLNLGMRTADGLVEVKNGLEPGEKLVVRGAEALRDGAEVRIDGEKPRNGKRGPR